MNDQAALLIQNLTVNYEERPALWDLNLSVPRGHLSAIVGPNGAGKSTLLKAALGLIRPLSGKVLFHGLPLKSMRKKIAYIPQRESVDWDFPITVFDLVLMGRYGKIGMLRWAGKKDKMAAKLALESVGMEEFGGRQISELSGGQQQRVFIARSLCSEADIYFMDEPFAGIDLASSEVVLNLLLKLKKDGKSIFVVHHDLSSVAKTYDWVIMLNTRMVACGPVVEVFTQEKICQTYGQDVLLLDQAAKLTKERREGRKC